MANSIADLLLHKDFDEPPEMRAIKHYVRDTYQEEVEVLIREQDIVVITASAALAATLRLRITQLRQAAKTSKKILFRIR